MHYSYESDNRVRVGNNDVENFKWIVQDEPKQYLTYDLSMCIICSHCTCACEEAYSTLALTIED